jgi:uncharacterized membrane protein YsdA (DUF1294 family)
MRSKNKSLIAGIVTSIEPNRRYGFVHSDDFEQDIFFLLSDLPGDPRQLQVGSSLRGTIISEIIRLQRSSPFKFFWMLSGFLAVSTSLIIWANFEVAPIIALLIGINVGTLFCMGLDKSLAASRSLRTPESIIYTMAILGGSPGVLLSIYMFRHKTRKAGFQFVLLLIFLAQAVILRALGITFKVVN